MSDEPEQREDDNEVLKTFDMYHFFSRTDVILAIVVLLALLGYVFYSVIVAAPGVT